MLLSFFLVVGCQGAGPLPGWWQAEEESFDWPQWPACFRLSDMEEEEQAVGQQVWVGLADVVAYDGGLTEDVEARVTELDSDIESAWSGVITVDGVSAYWRPRQDRLDLQTTGWESGAPDEPALTLMGGCDW